MIKCHTLFYPAHDTSVIDEFQDQFFPLRSPLSPHIKILTHRKCIPNEVMFPCLEETVSNFQPFEIHVSELDKFDKDGWLFLRVGKGRDRIVALQEALCKCIKEYMHPCERVEPKIPLGFFARDRQARQWAYEEAVRRDFSFHANLDRITTVVYNPSTNKILESQDFKLGMGP